MLDMELRCTHISRLVVCHHDCLWSCGSHKICGDTGGDSSLGRFHIHLPTMGKSLCASCGASVTNLPTPNCTMR